MATATPHTHVGPLQLPPVLIAAADLAILDIARENPAVATVSRAWALRELATCGCAALERMLDERGLTVLRAPRPARGAPRRVSTSETASEDRSEFHTIPPLLLPHDLVARLRQLAPRIAKATGDRPALASVLREAILVGHELRERERTDVERRTAEIRAALEATGFLNLTAFRAVGVRVLTPYAPPGPRAGTVGGASGWGHPMTLETRAPKPGTKTRAKPSSKPSSAVQKRTRAKATNVAAPKARARTPHRKPAKKRAAASAAGDDDGGDPPPPPPAEPAAPSTPRPLTELERQFIDFLIEQALRT